MGCFLHQVHTSPVLNVHPADVNHDRTISDVDSSFQHNHRLLAVKCQVSEFQHDIEGPAADHDYIDAGEEFLEPVRFLLTCVQEV